MSIISKAVKNDPTWQAAMIKRGFSDFSQIHVETWAMGDMTGAKDKTHRMFRSVFYLSRHCHKPYSRPIEGVSTIIDLK